MDVNFIKRPPAEAIRSALRHKIAGEIEVQEITEYAGSADFDGSAGR